MIWIFTLGITAPEGFSVLPVNAPVEGDWALRSPAKRVDSAITISRARKAVSSRAQALMHAATHKYPLATIWEMSASVEVFGPWRNEDVFS